MTLTRRGVAVVGCSVAAVVVAWVFGLPEAAMLAAAALVVVVAAVVTVTMRPPTLDVRRSARPPRVRLGQPCEVVLGISNAGRRRSPVVVLTDQVEGFGTAQLAIAPIRPGERTTTRYTLPTSRRGVQRVGPLSMRTEDPFGLATRRAGSESVTSVIVLPRTWPLTPLGPSAGDEPEHGARALTAVNTVDEEFASLREYVSGDDIRRIHWPSTARLGTPVVREFDVPWQRRTTVVVDLRAAAHDDRSLERVVSAAASVVELCARRTELVRLTTTAGLDSGFVPAGEELDRLSDLLAVASADHSEHRADRLVSTLDRLRRTPVGRLVVCAGAIDPPVAGALERTRRVAPGQVLVATDAGSSAHVGLEQLAGAVVRFDGSDDLSTAWAAATTSLDRVALR